MALEGDISLRRFRKNVGQSVSLSRCGRWFNVAELNAGETRVGKQIWVWFRGEGKQNSEEYGGLFLCLVSANGETI